MRDEAGRGRSAARSLGTISIINSNSSIFRFDLELRRSEDRGKNSANGEDYQIEPKGSSELHEDRGNNVHCVHDSDSASRDLSSSDERTREWAVELGGGAK